MEARAIFLSHTFHLSLCCGGWLPVVKQNALGYHSVPSVICLKPDYTVSSPPTPNSNPPSQTSHTQHLHTPTLTHSLTPLRTPPHSLPWQKPVFTLPLYILPMSKRQSQSRLLRDAFPDLSHPDLSSSYEQAQLRETRHLPPGPLPVCGSCFPEEFHTFLLPQRPPTRKLGWISFGFFPLLWGGWSMTGSSC